ncbi:MAG TPA: OmpA family protein, partial [Salinimicrobium sp.]|nr:OmpA family protein [Salinimicrobium sp.]
MKHLSKFLLASLFFMSVSVVQAQDENNPWAVGIGVNAVDFYPTGGDTPAGGHFEDFFNVGDHWNIIPAVSRISVGRYIGAGFNVEAAGSINKIEKFGDVGVDWSYYALDATFQYSLRSAFNGGWFDPVLGLGGGYTWVNGPTVSSLAPDGGPY